MNSRFRSKATAAPFVFAVMCVLVLSSCGNSSSSTTHNPDARSQQLGGCDGQLWPTGQAGGFVNEIFTTVTVCQHGTQNCATIPNVEIDTGSIGLRLLPSALGAVALTSDYRSAATRSRSAVQFGDTSYTWGPMELADVDIAGETASDIPVQLLGN